MALAGALLVNIVPLIITKYLGFIMSNVCTLFNLSPVSLPKIVMPIGISFYTFQVTTYIVDLYYGRIKRQKNLPLFALYIMFFPQLIAGPIVKYSEVEHELESPDVGWDGIKYGAGRFITGLGKKVLIANQAGAIASTVLESETSSLTTGITWLCVVAYTIQIYFDFSGYSEMAIGLGAMAGFHFPENFSDPYTSLSISEFWRRWHITLGRFFREYVYIPLGGNRVRKGRWVINMLIVWALTGLWHGASWNFVIWGLYYGVLIIINRTIFTGVKLPGWMSWCLTMLLVMLGWGIFMCDGVPLKQAFIFFGKLFLINGRPRNPVTVGVLRIRGHIPFLLVGVIISSPLWVKFLRARLLTLCSKKSTLLSQVGDLCLLIILIASIVFLIGGTYNPFIYYRF